MRRLANGTPWEAAQSVTIWCLDCAFPPVLHFFRTLIGFEWLFKTTLVIALSSLESCLPLLGRACRWYTVLLDSRANVVRVDDQHK